MKRFYTVLKQRRPDGVVDVHFSFTDPADGIEVVMDFPVKCANSALEAHRWQIDAGRAIGGFYACSWLYDRRVIRDGQV